MYVLRHVSMNTQHLFHSKICLVIFQILYIGSEQYYVSVSSGEMCIKGRGSDSPARVSTNERSGMILTGQSEAAHLTSEWLSEIMSCILAARADGWVTFTSPVLCLGLLGDKCPHVPPMSPPPRCHWCHNRWQGKLSSWSHWNIQSHMS